MDVALFHFINDTISNAFLDQVMPIISNKLTWIPLYALFIIVAVVKFKRQSWKVILAMIITFAITDLTSNAIKHSLKNKRPNQVEEIFAIKRVEGGSGYSTPSSHAANHMAIAVVVGLLLSLKWGWKLVLYAWAILIGFSRIYNGVHFPSDIFIGFGLGGLIAIIVYLLYKRFIPIRAIQKQDGVNSTP